MQMLDQAKNSWTQPTHMLRSTRTAAYVLALRQIAAANECLGN